jgi:hypothetical protein
MSQTTTTVGRMAIADPDLGYDVEDGGTALHTQLRTNVTAFSDHVAHRYKSVTALANAGSTTVTHNFGLNLSRLKVQIWESGILRTDAQVAADYTIAESGGSSTSAITITNNSGGAKTFIVLVFAGKLGVNSSDFDPACSIDTTGNIRAAELRTTGNDLVLNHDATGAGADWTSTLRRPSSGMTAAAVITLPSATSTLATLALTETFSNKTFASPTITGALTSEQISTPSNPSAGYNKLYPKSDGKWYNLKSDGTESELGSGAGSGEKNYISNPSGGSATTGWGQVGDLDITRTTTAAELPREYTTATGLKITADANTQSTADYVYFDFTLDDVDLNKKLKIEWSQKQTGSYAAGNLAVVITTQADRTTALHTPVTTAIPAADGVFTTTFDSSSTAALSLVIRATTDMATNAGIVISDVVVGPGTITQGAAVGPETQYTMTPSATTTSPTKGTVATDKAYWWREGEHMVVRYHYQQTGAGGSGSGTYLYPIPSGYTIDTSKLETNASASSAVGVAAGYDGTSQYTGYVGVYNTGYLVVYLASETSGATAVGSSRVPYGNANARISFEARIPIAEWAGNGTVNMLNNSVFYANTRCKYTGADTAGTWTSALVVKYQTKSFDTHNTYSTSTGLFTAPSAGTYRIYGSVQWTGLSTNTINMYVRKNGSDVAETREGASDSFAEIYDVVALNQGDTLGIYALAASGNPLNDAEGSRLIIERVQDFETQSAVGFGLAGTDGSAGLVNPYTQGSGVVYSGNYTPTLANGANVSSSSLASARYTRVGSIVTVTGKLSATLTSANTASVITLTLPVTSNMTAASDASGSVGTRNGNNVAGGVVEGDSGDLLVLVFANPATGSCEVGFSAQYIIK